MCREVRATWGSAEAPPWMQSPPAQGMEGLVDYPPSLPSSPREPSPGGHPPPPPPGSPGSPLFNPFLPTPSPSPTRPETATTGGNGDDEPDGGASAAGTGGGDGVDGGGSTDHAWTQLYECLEDLEKSIRDHAMLKGFKAVHPSSKGKADQRKIWVCQQGIVATKSQKKPSSSRQPHKNPSTRPATKEECCPWRIIFAPRPAGKYALISKAKDHNAVHTCKLSPAMALHNGRIQNLTPAVRSAIVVMAERRMKPMDIVACVRSEHHISLSPKDVANITRPIVAAFDTNCAAVVQELLRKKIDEGYHVAFL